MIRLQRALAKLISTASLVRARLRARLFVLRGARIAPKSQIGARCIIDRPWCLETGSRFNAEPDVYIKIVSDKALLKFGDQVFVGRGSEFDVISNVSVGDHTVIAPGCFVTDHNHGISPHQRVDQQERGEHLPRAGAVSEHGGDGGGEAGVEEQSHICTLAHAHTQYRSVGRVRAAFRLMCRCANVEM